MAIVNMELHQALSEMNLERAAELIRGGADINVRNEFGESLMYNIIKHGYDENGAEVDVGYDRHAELRKVETEDGKVM